MSEVNEDGYTFVEWLSLADVAVERECKFALGDFIVFALGDDDGVEQAWLNSVKPKDYAIMMLEESTFGEFHLR